MGLINIVHDELSEGIESELLETLGTTLQDFLFVERRNDEVESFLLNSEELLHLLEQITPPEIRIHLDHKTLFEVLDRERDFEGKFLRYELLPFLLQQGHSLHQFSVLLLEDEGLFMELLVLMHLSGIWLFGEGVIWVVAQDEEVHFVGLNERVSERLQFAQIVVELENVGVFGFDESGLRRSLIEQLNCLLEKLHINISLNVQHTGFFIFFEPQSAQHLHQCLLGEEKHLEFFVHEIEDSIFFLQGILVNVEHNPPEHLN